MMRKLLSWLNITSKELSKKYKGIDELKMTGYMDSSLDNDCPYMMYEEYMRKKKYMVIYMDIMGYNFDTDYVKKLYNLLTKYDDNDTNYAKGYISYLFGCADIALAYMSKTNLSEKYYVMSMCYAIKNDDAKRIISIEKGVRLEDYMSILGQLRYHMEKKGSGDKKICRDIVDEYKEKILHPEFLLISYLVDNDNIENLLMSADQGIAKAQYFYAVYMYHTNEKETCRKYLLKLSKNPHKSNVLRDKCIGMLTKTYDDEKNKPCRACEKKKKRKEKKKEKKKGGSRGKEKKQRID